MEKFSTKLSVILKAQGVSGPDPFDLYLPISSPHCAPAAFSFSVSKELMETTQSVKTKLQSFVKE